ncbi:MAG: ATP synthase F1 subunit delta, partial [Gaiellaceae bacterium]
MAVAHTVYAEALLAAAGEKGRLAEVREELADFARAVEESPELRSFLRNPQIEPPIKRDVLASLVGDAEELVRNFILLVAEKGRIAEIEDIQRELERLIAREARVLELDLTTAVELSDE